MATDFAKLGIIAGGGDLPRILADSCRKNAIPYFLVGIKGEVGDWLDGQPAVCELLTKPSAILGHLRKQSCDAVCMVGTLARPSISDLRLDPLAMKNIPKIYKLMRSGDDGLLRGIAEQVERQGFKIIAPDDVAPDLLGESGPIGKISPSADDRQDIARAAEIMHALGNVDIGQAVVIASGLCLGIETLEGTDALLERIANFAPERRKSAPIPGGVLYKAPKSGQDKRVDLPTIGPQTIIGAHKAGLNGVVYMAGNVLLVQRQQIINLADEYKLFVYGQEPTA